MQYTVLFKYHIFIKLFVDFQLHFKIVPNGEPTDRLKGKAVKAIV